MKLLVPVDGFASFWSNVLLTSYISLHPYKIVSYVYIFMPRGMFQLFDNGRGGVACSSVDVHAFILGWHKQKAKKNEK